MKDPIGELLSGARPFCLIQKQDSEEILILTGRARQIDAIERIPRKRGSSRGRILYDTVSMVPFCQIREKGYAARAEGEKILCIEITGQEEIPVENLLSLLPEETIRMQRDVRYDTTEGEYEETIRKIVEEEIGNGEGANFVVPRNMRGRIADFSAGKAFAIFRSLLKSDYGTYWKFIFYDGDRYFVGSTPERHLYVGRGRVKMNPISGTFRKDKTYVRRERFKRDLLAFLSDRKEINELFMVVDEELKMMARMCEKGGSIVGPLLKEMSRLIHSEYLLSGESDKDLFELFRDSMFAATVVGSPLESACNIVRKYSAKSRRYYGSAMMLIGRDETGGDFLDSPITIRMAEIDADGELDIAVGATLVRDSVPAEEVRETKAKSSALLGSIVQGEQPPPQEPMLAKLHNDDEIAETMVQRNQNLSSFWFFKQEKPLTIKSGGKTIRLTIIHNEDDFAYMLKHIFRSFSIEATIVSFGDYRIERDSGDITLVGPGPGNPNEGESEKIGRNLKIVGSLLERARKSIFICLGHQILCRTLGYEVRKKAVPLQGVQEKIALFGEEEVVGFYNTFVPIAAELDNGAEISKVPETDELIAIRGSHYLGFQFHPESILTRNGYAILKDAVRYLIR